MDLEAGFRTVAPRGLNDVLKALLAMQPRMETLGFTDAESWAALLGQCGHESMRFTRDKESLYYKAERLMEVWPRHFTSLGFARRFEREPEKLANYIYGQKLAKKLGNKVPEDGYRFRGRGWIQLTGRDNYTRAGTWLGMDLVAQPQLAQRPDVAFLVAAWFMSTSTSRGKTALHYAKKGDTEKVTLAINGDLHGLDDRRQLTARVLHVLRPARDTVREGDVSQSVTALQDMLTLLGYAPGPIDGWFGGATLDAVLAFQRAHGLEVDGIVGATTWKALDAAVAAL